MISEVYQAKWPIRQIPWSWNGTAIYTNGAWSLASGSTNIDLVDSNAPAIVSWSNSVQATLTNLIAEP